MKGKYATSFYYILKSQVNIEINLHVPLVDYLNEVAKEELLYATSAP